jgi:hypothetical protein
MQVYHFAFVVTRNRVLLGRLRPAVLDAGGDLPAEAVMEPGPSTVRGDSRLEPLAELMRRRDLTSLSVTTPDGMLLGVVPSTSSSRRPGPLLPARPRLSCRPNSPGFASASVTTPNTS